MYANGKVAKQATKKNTVTNTVGATSVSVPGLWKLTVMMIFLSKIPSRVVIKKGILEKL